jgi:hypothetical protein
MKFVGLVALALSVAPIVAGAQPAPPSKPLTPEALGKYEALLDFEAKATPYFRIGALAFRATTCNLRSAGWYQTIKWGAHQSVMAEAEKAGISPDEDGKIQAFEQMILKNVFDANPCSALMNSRTMFELDAVESRMTGGYH